MVFINQANVQDYWPFWLSWLVLFLIYEFNALRLRTKSMDKTNNGGTLSELVWWLIRGQAWWHHVFFGAFLVFFVDLGFHFFVGTHLF